jgi:hypothetical protein
MLLVPLPLPLLATADIEAEKRYQEKRAAEKAEAPTYVSFHFQTAHHTACLAPAAHAVLLLLLLLATADVEAEKRYQEKRAAEKAGEPLPPPPVVLWRSARELGVWVKDLRRARTTGALGGAAYAAAALVDRAHVSGVRWRVRVVLLVVIILACRRLIRFVNKMFHASWESG